MSWSRRAVAVPVVLEGRCSPAPAAAAALDGYQELASRYVTPAPMVRRQAGDPHVRRRPRHRPGASTPEVGVTGTIGGDVCDTGALTLTPDPRAG